MDTLTNFERDFIISWDFSDHDLPCVSIVALTRDPKCDTRIVAEHIGSAYTKTGVVSLRQLIDIFKDRKRYEEANK